jgi:hypothetical protein
LKIFLIIKLEIRYDAQCCEPDTISLAKAEIYHDLGLQDSMTADPIVGNDSEEFQICGSKVFADVHHFSCFETEAAD